jgi:hypothetical protein
MHLIGNNTTQELDSQRCLITPSGLKTPRNRIQSGKGQNLYGSLKRASYTKWIS